ncbi:S41 family peptidase [Chitinimonas prasina]|uniref:S41 family peptidase n=1 Tax=Chitinimonas prasina TaxID=1434937 RepID=UPI0024E09F8F|nr:S41 family peptidase [Chitinimonas prasina]
MRKLFCTLGLLLSTLCSKAAPTPSASDYLADFDTLATEVTANYAYFTDGPQHWQAAVAHYRPLAAKARDQLAFITVLEQLLEELHDDHTQLNRNTASSPRLVPSGTDLWAAWQGETARLVQVRPDSPAAKAGLQAGMILTHIQGQPIAVAVAQKLGRVAPQTSQRARDWALRSLLAGRRDQQRQLRLLADGRPLEVTLAGVSTQASTPLSHRRIGSAGYIRLNNSLGQDALITAFDAALAELGDSQGLILDLRDTPGGGNSKIARAIMSRFIAVEAAYQRHDLPLEAQQTGIARAWLELVQPRGPFQYTRPLVVLVDHWTGSMGEGLAIGLHGLGRAQVVGTAMAGLLGATYTIPLPHSGISANVPAERLFHVRGTPREDFQPPIRVDLAQPAGNTDDLILAAGLRELASHRPAQLP